VGRGKRETCARLRKAKGGNLTKLGTFRTGIPDGLGDALQWAGGNQEGVEWTVPRWKMKINRS